MMEPWETKDAEPMHGIIDDSMPATVHPSTGQVFESKSAFRAVTKACGLQEVGNDWKGNLPSSHKPYKSDRENIRRQLGEVLGAGYIKIGNRTI